MRGRDEIIKFNTFISLRSFSFFIYLCKGGEQEHRVTFIIDCLSRDSDLRSPLYKYNSSTSAAAEPRLRHRKMMCSQQENA